MHFLLFVSGPQDFLELVFKLEEKISLFSEALNRHIIQWASK